MAKPLKKNSLATDNRPDQPAFEDPVRKERMGELGGGPDAAFHGLENGTPNRNQCGVKTSPWQLLTILQRSQGIPEQLKVTSRKLSCSFFVRLARLKSRMQLPE